LNLNSQNGSCSAYSTNVVNITQKHLLRLRKRNLKPLESPDIAHFSFLSAQ